MAKKTKASEAAENKNLPQAIEWIKQPYTLSVIRGDMGLVQTRLLTGIVGQLQDKVGDWIAHRDDKGHVLINPEEFDKDGCIAVDVQLSDVSNKAQTYQQIEQVADDMQKLIFRKKVEEDGLIMNRRASVFKDVATPEYVAPSGKSRRAGFIRFRFDRDQINNIFEIMRYSKYIKEITMTSKSQYTNRIYMIITAYRDILPTFEMDYVELRKIFGFVEMQTVTVTDPETGVKHEENQWVDIKYPEYRQFKRRVLQTAENELKEMNEQGRVDCYFDFEEVFANSRKRGNPEKIRFFVHKSNMAKLEDLRIQDEKEYVELSSYIQSTFGLTKSETQYLLKKVPEDIVKIYSIRVHEIAASMEKQGDRIQDKKKYAVASLYRALNEFSPVEIKYEETIENIQEVTPENNESSECAVTEEDLERFSSVVKKVLPKEWKDAFKLVSVGESNIVISIPTIGNKKFFEEMHGTSFYERLNEVFGKAVKVVCDL